MVVLADILKAFEAADTLPDGQRQAAIIAAADRALALAGAETVALHDAGVTFQSGLSNPGHWLAHKANISKARGRRIYATGRLALRFEAIAEGIDEGVLSDDHLTVLKVCLPGNRSVYRAQVFDDHHKMLVDLARDLDFPDFKKACEAWIGLCNDADPDAKAPEDQELGLDFSDNRDGTTSLRGLLLTSDADLLKEGLTRLAERAKEQARRDEDSNPSQPEPVGGDPVDDLSVDYSISEYTLRPVVRRGSRYWMARAMGMIANLANSAPSDGKTPEPLLVVLMDFETLEAEKIRWANGEPRLPPDVVFRPGYSCETLDGKQITPFEAFRIALNHRIKRCVIDAESQKVDLGRSQRLFTGAAREAIIYRDRCCTVPGCGAPARWGEVDHIVEWQDGGETNVINGRLLCSSDHDLKTQAEKRWRDSQAIAQQQQDSIEPF